MKRRGFTLLELVVVIFAMLLVVAFTLAAVGNMDENRARVLCMSNLRQMGQAFLLYCNDNRGPYPKTIYDPNLADHPTAYTGVNGDDPFVANGRPSANDVSAAMFLLIRTEDIQSKAFVCPSSMAKHDDYGGPPHTALEKSNFPSADFLSYSYANPYPSREAVGRGYKLVEGVDRAFVVAADMNPGNDALLKLNTGMAGSELRAGNSLNHGGDGQNVLYGDGHVEFMNSPLCGIHRDNIYTYGDSGDDPAAQQPRPTGGLGVVGSPVGPDDSVLLPALNMETAASVTTALPVVVTPSPAPVAIDQGTDFMSWVLWLLAACVLAAIGLAIFAARQKRGNRDASGQG